MVSLVQLIFPILLAAVLVFAASSLIHMVFKWHNPDYRGFPNEDAVRTAIRAGNPAPGQYMIPYCLDPKEMAKPEVIQKYTEGPAGFLLLRAPGPPSMGKPLVQWFVLNLVIATLAAYLASCTVAPGATATAIARVVGVTTFAAYAFGGIHWAIWMGKPWISAIKECLLDGVIYAAVSAGAFIWLWPK